MSTAAPSKRQSRPNTPPPGRGLAAWLLPMLRSTVGTKFLIALTGLALVGFVIAHLAGNLTIFRGRHEYNNYAAFLKGQGALLWVARIGLLLVFVLHIVLSLRLRWLSAQARPVGYRYHQSIQAGSAARTMVLSGLLILLFTAFHIAHYTLGVVDQAQIQTMPGVWQARNFLDLHENPKDPTTHHDVYAMTYVGFKVPIIAALYILGQLVLILHLSHGVGSTLQSLGLNTPKTQRTVRLLSWAVALFVGLGNILIVVVVWFDLLQLVPPPPYGIK